MKLFQYVKKNKIKVGFTPFDEDSFDLIKNKCVIFLKYLPMIF